MKIARSHYRFVPVLLTVAMVRLTCLAKEDAVQCANLIYGVNQTSRCFSDEFLSAVQRDTAIASERRFRSVKLASEELFEYPFVIMTGESRFSLSGRERENMKKYLTSGGFLLASAGCSNVDWDHSFRREIKSMFEDQELVTVNTNHPVFHTVYDIAELKPWHPAPQPRVEGLELDGKLVILYSPQGLNDTAHTEGCCCCGGNEILNSMEMNVNVFVYALTH